MASASPSSSASPSLGGTCLNWGCIPTKALLEHAHALKIAQDASEWGINFGKSDAKPSIDMARVHQRKTKIVTGITKGVEFLFKKNKIEWIKGSGRLAGGGKVEVSGGGEDRTLTAREIIVATGSAPRSVPGIELDCKNIITSDEAVNLAGDAEVDRHHGQRRGRRRVRVNLQEVRRGRHRHRTPAAPRSERRRSRISAELEKAFRKRGIAVKTGTKVTSAKVKGGTVTIEMQSRPTERRRACRSRSCWSQRDAGR